MVKIQRTPIAPESLAAGKSYRKKDVWDQLYTDFHGKCYLCEKNELDSIEVEHLLPHHGGKYPERKYDWHNLFYSCAHCNSVKNQARYEENIIDCCRTEPEALIRQELAGSVVCVTPLVDTPEAVNTAALIRDCFELRNTGSRYYECQTKAQALARTMKKLNDELGKYQKTKSGKSLRILRAMLRREASFAGFTRTYVRNRIDRYPELEKFVAL